MFEKQAPDFKGFHGKMWEIGYFLFWIHLFIKTPPLLFYMPQASEEGHTQFIITWLGLLWIIGHIVHGIHFIFSEFN